MAPPMSQPANAAGPVRLEVARTANSQPDPTIPPTESPSSW